MPSEQTTPQASDSRVALAAFLTAVRNTEQTALQGALNEIERCAALDGIPSALVADLNSYKAQLNERLSSLLKDNKVLEVLQIGSDVSYGFRSIEETFKRVLDMHGECVAKLKKISESAAGLKPSTEVAGLVTAEVDRLVAEGAIIRKEALELSVKQAREAGIAEGRRLAQVAVERAGRVTALGLAAPPDDVLALGDEDFEKRFGLAKSAVEKLGKCGVKPAEICGAIAGLPWQTAEAQAPLIASIELGYKLATGAGENPVNPASKGDPAPDPGKTPAKTRILC